MGPGFSGAKRLFSLSLFLFIEPKYRFGVRVEGYRVPSDQAGGLFLN